MNIPLTSEYQAAHRSLAKKLGINPAELADLLEDLTPTEAYFLQMHATTALMAAIK